MRTIIFFVCLTGLLFACYDDKGNYDYNEINQITIQGIDSLIRCDQMDLLYIPVTSYRLGRTPFPAKKYALMRLPASN